MSANGYFQLFLYLVVLLALAKPVGTYMARIYEGQPAVLNRVGAPLERLIYRICGVDPAREMRWTHYALAMLAFNLLGGLAVYGVQRLQAYLPLNPQAFAAVSPDSSFNTAVSFISNTNWQGYGGESTMSYLTQMAALGVQNFVSAATGMAILLISGALCYMFGKMVGDTRQRWAILAAMTLVFVILLAVCVGAEQAGNPALEKLGVDQTTSALQAGANMEGKETRFGIVKSALWATATTAASNGSGNAMHDSFTPIGGLVPMWLIQLGEVIFGGVANPGGHGFSEILYAFSSASNNNGSAFAGLSANTPYYNTALGLCMLFSRYWLAIPVLAIAGALATKKKCP